MQTKENTEDKSNRVTCMQHNIYICKSYYRQNINEELGSISTYAKWTVELQQLIRKHTDFLKQEYPNTCLLYTSDAADE